MRIAKVFAQFGQRHVVDLQLALVLFVFPGQVIQPGLLGLKLRSQPFDLCRLFSFSLDGGLPLPGQALQGILYAGNIVLQVGHGLADGIPAFHDQAQPHIFFFDSCHTDIVLWHKNSHYTVA